MSKCQGVSPEIAARKQRQQPRLLALSFPQIFPSPWADRSEEDSLTREG
ncbi:MAG: hypothetical protein NZ899_02225 [Thermoguttaceae bacterium]|nr:hypothetical protein [Thermoguttaceae bacterium]MDW8078752.1 hypothetical protein [Thermoguttaceae bacterium]